jgi:glycolate oxidase iron-sulfur subunit
VAQAKFSHELIPPVMGHGRKVALLTGCVQDIVLADVNRDTAEVLAANGCEVHTPPVQPCCGSLHAHNGEPDTARLLARRMLDLINPADYDAIITNAAGCGSHLKTYGRLLADDPAYRERAEAWSAKLKDVHEWLNLIGLRKPQSPENPCKVTYHEACHLCHGQKITKQPRAVLKAIPGLELTELGESTWCCGSAGIYNITQPEMSAKLLKRKVDHIGKTGADVVAAANPGCHLQIANGLREAGSDATVAHPISLLAQAYRTERDRSAAP